jgi:hypothetical protein
MRHPPGGNTLFGGFVERLEKELKGLLDQRQQAFKIVAPPDRRNLYASPPPQTLTRVSNA